MNKKEPSRDSIYSEVLKKKISRRDALSTGAKIGIGTVVGIVVGTVAGYLGGRATLPPPETVTKTMTVEKTKTTTLTETTTVTSTVATTASATPVVPSYKLERFEGVELRVPHPSGWGSWEPGLKLVPEFEEATGIKVKLDMLSWDDNTPKQLLEARQMTGVYDVSTVNVTEPLHPYLRPLTHYIEELYGSIEAFENDILSMNLQRAAMWEGEYVMIPMHANTVFMIYRKELFEDPENQKKFEREYGRELTPPKTFDELHEVASFFNNPPEFWGIATMNHRWIINTNVIHTLYDEGYDLLDKDFRPIIKYNDKARETLINIIKWWQDAYQKYKYVSAETLKWLDGELFDFFSAGRAAIALYVWDDFWGTIPGYNDPDVRAKIGRVAALPIPSLNPHGVHKGGIASWWTHGIPKGAKNPDAAWQYIKWAISDRVQLTCATGQFPPYKHQAEIALKRTIPHAPDTPLFPSREIFESMKNAKIDIYNYAAGKTVPELQMEPTTLFRESLELCYLGKMTPEEVVDKFADAIEKKLEEAGYYKG